MNTVNKKLTKAQKEELLDILKVRFEENGHRHNAITWDEVYKRLEVKSDKLWSLNEMEISGGEPDVVSVDDKTGEILFYDCSEESPEGRRKVCYDKEGLESRKNYKPEHNAVDMAAEMGIELLTEQEYRKLQDIEQVDMKTSSWLKTPSEMRELGGALFGDRRFGRVFIYHNGAQSYYGARGFRGCLRV